MRRVGLRAPVAAVAMMSMGMASPVLADTVGAFEYYTQTFVLESLSDPDGTVNDPPGTIQEPIDPAPVSNLIRDVNGATSIADTGRFTSPRGVSARSDLGAGELGVRAQSSYQGVLGALRSCPLRLRGSAIRSLRPAR